MGTHANSNLHSAAGRTILEMLEEQADYKYADFMELHGEEKNWDAERISEAIQGRGDDSTSDEEAEEIVKSAELRGVLRGLTFAIAFLRNPYDPDVDAEKSALHDRWEMEDEEDEEE